MCIRDSTHTHTHMAQEGFRDMQIKTTSFTNNKFTCIYENKPRTNPMYKKYNNNNNTNNNNDTNSNNNNNSYDIIKALLYDLQKTVSKALC